MLISLQYYDELLINRIPRFISGVPVVVDVVGEIRALADQNIYRPIRGGSQIQNVKATTQDGGCRVGTLGGFPFDNNGNPVILSNNHVIALDTPYERIGAVGDQINQPGCASNPIGTLAKWKTILNKGSGTNKVDAAYATINGDITIDNNNLCNYSLGPTVAPQLGMNIKKIGRTTGCTHGTIEVIDQTMDVSYCSGGCLATFTGTVRTSSNFSAGGDSGSVVATESTGNAVALLFAANQDGITWANPMSDVEQALGISFTPPGKKYRCTGSPDYACVEDPAGGYDTIDACRSACTSCPEFLCSMKMN